MESLIVNGGKNLMGQSVVAPAKNAVLPIIACCIMSRKEIVLQKCPKLADIDGMINIINSIGGRAFYQGDNIVIDCKHVDSQCVDTSLTSGIRSSIFILGPILARFRKANICYPGGCEIGKRPIDLHIFGLRMLNVKVEESEDVICCDGTNMRAGTITLSLPSVGATENLMMSAVLTEGITIIKNAAREPEIVDLQNFINYLGGRVSGAGTSTITVCGVTELGGGQYTPVADRIVAGTIMAGVAICGGEVELNNIEATLVSAMLEVFEAAGCGIKIRKNSIVISSHGRLNAVRRIETRPFPYFPTDMQAQVMAMLTLADGTSVIQENLFENRFRHAGELIKMGANIEIRGNEATIRGAKNLHAAEVAAMDLRGGAALVLAALAAEGRSTINDIYHIDRGYESIETIFGALGASIKRVSGA